MWHTRCNSKTRLDGKTAVITGANTGIGKETARDFYRRGARVILVCRDIQKAEQALEDLKQNPPSRSDRQQFEGGPGELAIYPLDLSSLKSVKECAKTLLTKESAIHILVNNAGIMMCPYQKTKDGYELQLQTNYLSHFLLTLLLLPKMQSSAPGCRIVNVSSVAHNRGSIDFEDLNLEKSYTPLKAYAQSKLANILFTKELACRLKKANIDGVNVYSLHPGIIRTELYRHLGKTIFPGARMMSRLFLLLYKNSEQGAQTTIYCSVDEKAADETGLYYTECSVANPHLSAKDDRVAKELWDQTCRLLHLTPDENLITFLRTVAHHIVE